MSLDKLLSSSVSKKLSYSHYRYCSKCSKYLIVDSYRCPYCGNILRTKPRRMRYKKFNDALANGKVVDPEKYGVKV
ncbi:MAG: hypothetical protein QXP38_00165 [Nitrososphaerota archaeon]